MNLPSVKTIEQLGLSRQTAKKIRERIESILNGRKSIDYNRAAYLLTEIEETIEAAGERNKFQTFGVESIPPGSNKKSPGIIYLNTGETYSPTFMILDNCKIRIGNWGSIVEMGDYE